MSQNDVFDDVIDVDFSTPVETADTAIVEQPKQGGALATLDFNTIDLGLNIPGVMVVDTGTKVSRFPIERLKFTASKKERISIILDKAIVIKTHYSEELGAIICNGGYCCEALGLPTVRYLFPIVHYTQTDNNGKPFGSDIDVKLLSVGKDAYDQLCTIQDNKGSLTQFDLVVNCTDEGYQKCSYVEAGDAKWKRVPKLLEQVADILKKHGKDLTKCMGRSMDDATLKKALGVDAAPGFDSNVSMDDLFGN